ncbi:M56 family metallopeptidase [Mycolicibacterium pyrenivorans]|uniref:M56 family metallopeptidase n=1 Tax=Mycolicibacterium pyrenivorans TaxID=187102 RepID=UPI0021F25018|nr:M56 family metallopeptidase [Mycolicibacterium pyrenivorans]MCV7153073.1 M56 family metallopeptidase [Mycolicibacterium pyrenivorans]
MNAVTFLLTYAVALSWLAPVVLTSPAAAARRPQLVVTGWLVAVGTALAAWIGAVVVLVVGAVHAVVTRSALTFCVETLGLTEAFHLPSSVATVVVVALLVATTAVALHTGHRLVGSLLRTRRRNREHTDAVKIIGRPTDHRGVVAIGAEQPAAYCVSGGGSRAIVVTTAALRLLDPAGLSAVLSHERAHMRGRHHHIIATVNALSAALPRLPLMRTAAQSLPALLEMCADDAAAARHGREPLLRSLFLLSTGRSLPEGALAAAGTAVLDRMLRLAQPPAASRRWSRELVAAFVIAGTCLTPAVALTFCTL